ncbi:MAG: DinB family protein [Ktedonobacteraceae bacterium]|nr:DinB family protein [Ktedonobacteraceae bacterium]
MNAAKLLEQSHMMVLSTVDDFPERQWDIPGVCGNWSVKDIIAHLTSYEHLLVDVLNTLVSDAPTPYLDKFVGQREKFNTSEVAARQYQTAQQVIDEYNETQLQSTDLLTKIPAEKITRVGTVPWNKDRCVADEINNLYAHTSEHCMQIKAFREQEPA